MIDLIPAHPSMLRLLDLQAAQANVGGAMDEQAIRGAMAGGTAFAAVENGRILTIAGVFEIWQDRAVLWGLLSNSIGASMVPLHRCAVRGLAASRYRRIEAHVEAEHAEGHRWIRMLGFEQEGVMRQFWNRRDYALYSRIRSE
jgi:hypothetical protein